MISSSLNVSSRPAGIIDTLDVTRDSISLLLTLAAMASFAGHSHAQDGVDKAKAASFDNKVFAAPLGQKTYACFVRRYDASHLAQHPRQKVSAMKLLVTAEIPPDEIHDKYIF